MQNSRLSIKAALRWLCRIPPGNPELQSRLPSPRADQRGGLIWLAEPTGHRSGVAWQLVGEGLDSSAVQHLTPALQSLPSGVEVFLGTLSTPVREVGAQEGDKPSLDLHPRAREGVSHVEHKTWLLLSSKQPGVILCCRDQWASLLTGLGFAPVDAAPEELQALWSAGLTSDYKEESHLHLQPWPGAHAPTWPNGSFGSHLAQTWTYLRWTCQDDRLTQRQVLQARRRAQSSFLPHEKAQDRAQVLWDAWTAGDGLTRPLLGCVIRAASPLLREQAQRHLRRVWQEHGVSSKVVAPTDRRRHLAALPWILTERELLAAGQAPVLTTSELAQMLPLRTSLLPQRTAVRGLPLRTLDGERLQFNPHHPDSTGTLILGQAGAGSSFVSNALLTAHLQEGGTAWSLRQRPAPVFDAVHRAQTVVLAPGAPVSLNPLSLLTNESHFFDTLPLLRGWLLSLMQEVPSEFAVMAAEEALFRAWTAHRSQAGLQEVLAELRNLGVQGACMARDLQSQLASLGMAWFSGKCNLPLAAPYLSLDPSAFASSPDEALICRTLLALHGVALDAVGLGPRSMLVVDAAGVLGRTGAERLLEQCLRRARGRGCAMVWTDHYFPSERSCQSKHEAVLAETCNNVLLLRGELATTRGWASQLGVHEGWLSLLDTNPEHSRFLLAQRNRCGLVELALCAPATATMRAWPPEALEPFHDHLARGQTPMQALQHLAPFRDNGCTKKNPSKT